MTTLEIGIGTVVGLFVMLGMGVPVAVSLGLVGFVGLCIAIGPSYALSIIQSAPYCCIDDSRAVLPLFVLMGTLAASSGITTNLFQSANMWLGRVRGGLY